MIVSIIIGLLIFFAALAWFLDRIADMDEECRVCNGSGVTKLNLTAECLHCFGEGIAWNAQTERYEPGYDCWHCEGKGAVERFSESLCGECHGRGFKAKYQPPEE